MTCAAIIVAGGSGSRAGGELPKQFQSLGGRPLLHHTIQAFADHAGIDRIVLVINPDHRELLGTLPAGPVIVAGGANRTASVRAGLAALAETPPDLVLIHDGARPLVTASVISGVIDGLAHAEAAIPALPVTDAMVRRTTAHDLTPIDRDGLHRVQTPQGFHYARLWAAYQALPAGEELPDDAAVAARVGLSQILTRGDEVNIKVTWPEDFDHAEQYLNARRMPATGSGFDVHRLEPGEFMMLCGVRIEDGLSLIGHSDADVGLHAVTDALLGAIGKGDIGDLFPPTDERWKGADSSLFLREAVALAIHHRAQITHADITLICERPKIGPCKAQMRETVSNILGIPPRSVNIKATTTEGLGFTGRGEGIAAQAMVTVLR